MQSSLASIFNVTKGAKAKQDVLDSSNKKVEKGDLDIFKKLVEEQSGEEEEGDLLEQMTLALDGKVVDGKGLPINLKGSDKKIVTASGAKGKVEPKAESKSENKNETGNEIGNDELVEKLLSKQNIAATPVKINGLVDKKVMAQKYNEMADKSNRLIAVNQKEVKVGESGEILENLEMLDTADVAEVSESIKPVMPSSLKNNVVALKYGNKNINESMFGNNGISKVNESGQSKDELMSTAHLYRGEPIFSKDVATKAGLSAAEQKHAAAAFANQQKAVGGSIFDFGDKKVSSANATLSNSVTQMTQAEGEKSIFKIKDIATRNVDVSSGDNVQNIKDSFFAKQHVNGHLPVTGGTTSKLNDKKAEISNSSNPIDLITKITDYIQQNGVASKNGMDIAIHDDSLGVLKLTVTNGAKGDGISMDIQAATKEGHRFFVEHERSLIEKLNDSGINISSFKVGHQSSVKEMLSLATDKGSSFGQDSSFDGSGRSNTPFAEGKADTMLKRENQNSDSERRKMLWEMFKEKRDA